MNKSQTATICLISSFFLAGCLIPERFSARANFQPDGAYTFSFNGTVINALAAMQLKSAGSLTAKDEDALKADVSKMEKKPGVKKFVYKGSARYDLEMQESKKTGEAMRLFDMFTIRTDPKTGITELTSVEITSKSKAEFDQVGIKIDGKLEVSLPKNAEVVSSNATSTPTFGFGIYSWKIGGVEQRPSMKVKFK
jgi:hypothetical protein